MGAHAAACEGLACLVDDDDSLDGGSHPRQKLSVCSPVGHAIHAKLAELEVKDKQAAAATQLSHADQKIRDGFLDALAQDRQQLAAKVDRLAHRYDLTDDRKNLLLEPDPKLS